MVSNQQLILIDWTCACAIFYLLLDVQHHGVVSVASVHSISWSSEKENASASHPAGVMVTKLWTPEDPRSLRTHQESSGGPFAQAN